MRIAEVIGCVTLSRWHPSLAGGRFPLAVPLTLDELSASAAASRERKRPEGEELVIYDQLGAGLGSRIAMSEGGEAAQPFYPDMKPIDAYNAAILDTIHMQAKAGAR
ncbi:MAG TPA: EutN/CcmL family microcompartment protein [Pirellulales bacterium]|nr:EutN/CcmL family microcompartment protein [Pirellulales bacterium]